MNLSRALPPELERRLEEIALRRKRRQRLRAVIRFGIALLALIVALAVALPVASRWNFPQTIPLAAFALAAAAAGWLLLYRPTRRVVTLKRLALYIDEHRPELENRIVSAVDFAADPDGSGSDILVSRFLEEINALAPELVLDDLVDPRSLARLRRTAVLVWVLLLGGLVTIQQAWLPFGSFAMFSFHGASKRASAEPPFTVEPGDARVRRGANQVVWVTTRARNANETIRSRDGENPWQTHAMLPSSSDDVQYFQYMNLQEDVQYQVTVGGQCSPVYAIRVWTPPEVVSLDLSLHYPDYLALPVKEIVNGGDVTAIEGTRIDLDVQVNKPLDRATLVLESGPRVELAERSDAHWTGRLTVARNDRYHVELKDRDGEPSEYNPDHRIVALPDKPPKIEVAFPKGDAEATAIDEIPFVLKVSDDFGVGDFGIQYAVAGQDPTRLSLRSDALPTTATESRGEHTILLENLDLKPGDLVTWSAWATDRKPDRNEFDTVGDPYFLEIRPFRRNYREALSNQGGEMNQDASGASRGNEDVEEKEVIIATWNLRREALRLEAADYEKRLGVIVDSQNKLLEKVRAGNMLTGAANDPAADAGQAMEQAVKALREARLPDPAQQLSQALTHEQEAYRRLLRAKPPDSQVMQARGQGGRQGQNARELNQLEMDRRRDFYEEAKTQKIQQEQTEEALNEIKDLAKRQKIVNEDMARLISELEKQRQDEQEELKRKLERLREEQQRNLSRLDELAGRVASGETEQRQARQQIQDARDQMNRSVDSLRQEQVQQARVAGNRALDSLGQAQTEFERLSGAQARQRLANLQREMDELKTKQDSIVEGIGALQEQAQRPGLDLASSSEKAVGDLLEEKSSLSNDLMKLFNETAELSEKAARSQELMARKLGDWLRDTSRQGIPQAIEQGKPMLQYGGWRAALAQEKSVQDQLEKAGENLRAVSDFMSDDDLKAMKMALDQLRGILDEHSTETLSARAEAGRPSPNADSQGDRSAAAPRNARGDREARPGESPDRSGSNDQQGRRQAQQQDAASERSASTGQPGERQSGQPGASEQSPSGEPRNGQGSISDNTGNPSTAADRRGGNRSLRPDLGDRRDGPNGGSRAWGPYSPDDMRRFIDSDYRRWTDALRNAEGLLPNGDPNRLRIADVRGEIETMRRAYLRERAVPGDAVFVEKAVIPLAKAADELRQAIERKSNNGEFAVAGEEEVPAQYTDRVAEYFKALAGLGQGR